MAQFIVSVENLAPTQGTLQTPLWFGFHNGNFDVFSLGEAVSPGVERLAEDGSTALITEEFANAGFGVVQGTIAGLEGENAGPLDAGEMATFTVELDETDPNSRYFSYASMVIPSNDTFIANDDPLAFRIFDDDGNFLGADFIVTVARDAGTEVNDEVPANTAFFGQATPNTGVDENGVATDAVGFNPVGSGGILDDPNFGNADYTAPGYEFVRIRVYSPLTPGTPNDDLLLSGVDFLGSENQVLGLDGNDEIDSALEGVGNNTLDGGLGDDTLVGFEQDQLFGGPGNDLLISDPLDATPNANLLSGGAGDDELEPDQGDTVLGGAGDDTIFPGRGGNEVTGGAGNDVFRLAIAELPSQPNRITDFNPAEDALQVSLDSVMSFADLTFTQEGDDVVVGLAGSATPLATVQNTAVADFVDGTNIFVGDAAASNNGSDPNSGDDAIDGLVRLKFIGEDLLDDNTGEGMSTDSDGRLLFQGARVGGLSGISYDALKGLFKAISDDRGSLSDPRFYTLGIDLSDGSLDDGDVSINAVTTLVDETGEPFALNDSDFEGIAVTENGSQFISSERDMDGIPEIFEFSAAGSQLQPLPVPDQFVNGTRTNLGFESLTLTPDQATLYAANENALVTDGDISTADEGSVVRILQYDLTGDAPVAVGQFLYQVDPVPPVGESGSFDTNGLVELIALDNSGTLLALERSFTAEGGNGGKIYQINVTSAEDISNIDGVVGTETQPIEKTLVFDLADLGITIDNVEGMTLGPVTYDGKQTLIIVSDDNFDGFGEQNTQVLAFELTVGAFPPPPFENNGPQATLLNRIGSFNSEIGAEINAFDPTTNWLFVVSGNAEVEVLSLADPENPTQVGVLDLSMFGDGANSVAVGNDGLVAVAVGADPQTDPGNVVFIEFNGDINTPTFTAVEVGALPDNLTFTPDGTKVLVANEGEPDDGVDPDGSISIIDIAGGVGAATVATASFDGFNGREAELRAKGVRIAQGTTVAQDVEPEFISVAPDGTTAFVTLQENNAFAVVDIESATIQDILPLGAKDFSQGPLQLKTQLELDLPVLGTTEAGQEILLGGLSGLWYAGTDETGNKIFYTIPDRGPNPDTLDVDGDGTNERPFALPDYQARIVELTVTPDHSSVSISNEIFLTRFDGTTPITGISNVADGSIDEQPVDLFGNPLPFDPLGGDFEGILIDGDGNFWMSDEYRPAIYKFSPTGVLLDRFVPEGTANQVGLPDTSFGTETLPAEYINRRSNRGFEAIALDPEGAEGAGLIYAFIQTPLANPDRATSDNSDIIRILGINAATGVPVAEYVYLLEDSEVRPGGRVDKIGDAVFDPDTGNLFVIERDAAVGPDAKKFIFEINLTGATNVLGQDFGDETLEQQTPDDLEAAGIRPVNKIKLTNLPSIGYQAGDKPEGLALLEDGSLAVLNDNDFGLAGGDIPLDGSALLNPEPTPTVLGILEFTEGNRLDPSDRDHITGNLANHPVFGLYQPDSIASYEVDGRTYYVTANEGDARDAEEERIADLTLDPEAFPNAAELQDDAVLGRLEVTNADGDLDGDGDFDQLFSYGGRSFSIWDEFGNQVFDSGDDIARITLAQTPEFFNANDGDPGEVDARSDAKGAEPEAVTVGQVGDRTYAFVGLERAGGGVLIYDVTDPFSPEFLEYARDDADIAPEGLTFIPASESSNGKNLLVITNEESNTVAIWEFAAPASVSSIQGAGHRSAFEGSTVVTSGIVTAVAFNGFYLQDPEGDGDDATSDGIFVFTGGGPDVAVGDEAEVVGTVSEFIPGGAATGNLSVTQIAATDTTVLSSDNPLPAAVVIGEGGRLPSDTTVISADELPVNLQEEAGTFNPDTDAIDFFEALEGQLVTIEDAVAVSPTRVFSPFSAEAVVLPNQGANVSPEDALTERGTINLSSGPGNTGDQNPERVQIQFDPTISGEATPPELNVGDQLGDVTGVVGYSFGNFEVNVTGPVEVATPGGLEQETTELTGTEDNQLTVASYNVLNLTSTLAEEGGTTDPDASQRTLLAQQIVTNLGAPDIIALQEIQDNDGVEGGDNALVSDATQTLQDLVDAIANTGGPTYAFFDVYEDTDPSEFTELQGGAPSGNIRNAFLYNPERVTLDSIDALTPTALTEAGVTNPDAFAGSRVPLIGNFIFNGASVSVINNHLTSRFGSTPVFGGPQPFVQAGEAEREAQAQALNEFVDAQLANDAEARIIVTGDLNTFEFTNDLAEILPGAPSEEEAGGEGTGDTGADGEDTPEAVLTRLDPATDDDYTFIFDGNAQSLDHVFVTNALAEDAEVDVVHVNNDFTRDDNRIQFQDQLPASDHEPVVSRFTVEPDTFQLQILHASDLEGGVDAIDRAPNFAAITDALDDDFANTVILSAGDNYLPGPFLNAAGDQGAFRDSGLFNDIYNELFGTTEFDSLREGGGRVDIAIMNIIGFDASAIGNHEFDLGSDFFESVIEEDFRDPAGPAGDRNVGAQFPYLSANLDFSGDEDLSDLFTDEILLNTAFQTGPDQSTAANSDVPKIAPSTLIEEGGELIGVIGATTQVLESISSPTGTVSTAGVVNDMPALAAVLQPQIDALIAAGTNKVILVSHLQQIALEQELIGLLSGVDVVIAGGSDTILANGDDVLRPGDVAADTFPIVTTNADGDPAVIVSTNGEYSYVGQLVVDFNAEGILIDAEGNPLDAVDDLDLANNGPIATTDESVVAVTGAATVEDAIANSTQATQVQRLTDAVSDVVAADDGNVFGLTDVFLDGNRESVRTEETNFGNLTADANLAIAQDTDPTVKVSIKNGGGIRAPIGEVDADGNRFPPQANPVSGKLEGQISQLDIDNSLRFNNGLSLLTLTAAELKRVLEHGVAATAPGATPGQFPQVSGLDFSFDPNQQAIEFERDADGNVTGIATEGQRIQSLALTSETGFVTDVLVENGELVGDPDREIRIVTLNFLAGGGDSYPFPEFGADRVDLVNPEATEADRTGAATFADDGSEQDALAEFLAANFPADDDPTTPAFTAAETDPADDTRIQNLTQTAADTVLDTPAAQVLAIISDAPDGLGPVFYDATQFDANDNITTTLANDPLGLGTDAAFDNLVGFYQIVDSTGGIDTDGDGAADLQPGDAGYARAALTNRVDDFQIRAGSSGDASMNTTVDEFGDVILAGGARYAPFVIANGGGLGFQGFIDAEDAEAAAGGTFNGPATTVTDPVAYFSFLGANPDGAEHLQSRGNNVFGFEDLPANIFSDMDFNDAIFSFSFAG